MGYKIYHTPKCGYIFAHLVFLVHSKELLQCFDAGNETTTLLYRCMNAISIVGFSFLNLILVEK